MSNSRVLIDRFHLHRVSVCCGEALVSSHLAIFYDRVLKQQTEGLVFEVELFSSEVLVLYAALCHSHSQYTPLSISIITAPQGQRKKSLCTDLNVCVLLVYDCCCFCTTVRKKCTWLLDVWALYVGESIFLFWNCIFACLCIFSMLKKVCLCVFMSLPFLCGILLLSNRHLSVCYLSKLKAPVVF